MLMALARHMDHINQANHLRDPPPATTNSGVGAYAQAKDPNGVSSNPICNLSAATHESKCDCEIFLQLYLCFSILHDCG